jgi:hypothetical protein
VRGNPPASREPSETGMAGEQLWQSARPWVAIMPGGISSGSSHQGLTSRLEMETKPKAGSRGRGRREGVDWLCEITHIVACGNIADIRPAHSHAHAQPAMPCPTPTTTGS